MSDTTRLIESLKVLRKGDGLTLGSIAMLSDVELTFGTDDCRAIRQAITDAIATERTDKCVAALANAYGIDTGPGLNLMERRRAYAKAHRMAMRTLTNYEEFGAFVVAQLLELPIATTAPRVDRWLAVVEDISHRALHRGAFTPDERASIQRKLIELETAADAEISEPHAVRLAALIDQFQSAARSTMSTAEVVSDSANSPAALPQTWDEDEAADAGIVNRPARRL